MIKLLKKNNFKNESKLAHKMTRSIDDALREILEQWDKEFAGKCEEIPKIRDDVAELGRAYEAQDYQKALEIAGGYSQHFHYFFDFVETTRVTFDAAKKMIDACGSLYRKIAHEFIGQVFQGKASKQDDRRTIDDNDNFLLLRDTHIAFVKGSAVDESKLRNRYATYAYSVKFDNTGRATEAKLIDVPVRIEYNDLKEGNLYLLTTLLPIPE